MYEAEILILGLIGVGGAISLILFRWYLNRNQELIPAGRGKKVKQQIFEPAILLARGVDRIWTFTKAKYCVEDGKVETANNTTVNLPNDYMPERIMPLKKPGKLAWFILTVKGTPVKLTDTTTLDLDLHPIMNPTHRAQKDEKKSFKILTSPRLNLDNKTIMMLLIGAVFGIFIGIVAAPYLPTAHQAAPTIVTLFPNGTMIPLGPLK